MPLPTTEPVHRQIQANHNKIADILAAAALENVNVLCLQETWSQYTIDMFL